MSLTESYIDTIVCNERNFNSIILSIGKEEYNYIKENGNVEIIYEEGKISNFFKRIKEAILSVWNRIKEMFFKSKKVSDTIAKNAEKQIEELILSDSNSNTSTDTDNDNDNTSKSINMIEQRRKLKIVTGKQYIIKAIKENKSNIVLENVLPVLENTSAISDVVKNFTSSIKRLYSMVYPDEILIKIRTYPTQHLDYFRKCAIAPGDDEAIKLYKNGNCVYSEEEFDKQIKLVLGLNEDGRTDIKVSDYLDEFTDIVTCSKSVFNPVIVDTIIIKAAENEIKYICKMADNYEKIIQSLINEEEKYGGHVDKNIDIPRLASCIGGASIAASSVMSKIMQYVNKTAVEIRKQYIAVVRKAISLQMKKKQE